jgi:hypothetical protein
LDDQIKEDVTGEKYSYITPGEIGNASIQQDISNNTWRKEATWETQAQGVNISLYLKET